MALFPAHAGVILPAVRMPLIQSAFPRTRGGDPYYMGTILPKVHFSPHTRG